jgi:hypothetical protein
MGRKRKFFSFRHLKPPEVKKIVGMSDTVTAEVLSEV